MTHASLNRIISINELWRFFNHSANLFCIAGADGYLKQINPYLSATLGFPEGKLLSTPYIDFIHEDDRASSLEQSIKINATTPVSQFRNRVKTSSGSYRYISWSATYIPQEGNVYLIGQDLTETHLMEEKLKEEKLNAHKRILEAAIMGQEKERAEIGKELHDNVNQILATAILYNSMAAEDKGDCEQLIAKSSEIILRAVREIRHLSKSLVGPEVKKIGLIDCIQELTNTLQAGAKLPILFSHSGPLERLPVKVKFTVFRIIQEQLNNILKHAEAKAASVVLDVNKKFLSLTITDDGKGFDTRKKKNGIGLSNIQSRAEIYDGSLTINSSIGKGCSLNVCFPSTSIVGDGD